jgi:carboxyl-terminal processing protease
MDAARALDPRSFQHAVRLIRRKFYDRRSAARVAQRVNAHRGAPADLDLGAELDALLAELGTSHTHRFTADQLAYYEALAIYGQDPGFRRRLRPLFPPHGKVTYPGIGIVTAVQDAKNFITHVYDGGPAARRTPGRR